MAPCSGSSQAASARAWARTFSRVTDAIGSGSIMVDGPPPAVAVLGEMGTGAQHPAGIPHAAAVRDSTIPTFGRDGGHDRLPGNVDPMQGGIEPECGCLHIEGGAFLVKFVSFVVGDILTISKQPCRNRRFFVSFVSFVPRGAAAGYVEIAHVIGLLQRTGYERDEFDEKRLRLMAPPPKTSAPARC